MIHGNKMSANFWYNDKNLVDYVYSVVIMKEDKVNELIELKRHYKHDKRRQFIFPGLLSASSDMA